MTDTPDLSSPNGDPGRARQLFRYLGGDEWPEYRAILRVFASTFFAEFTPEEVETAVSPAGIDPSVVGDRLESLRRWGNLTVSSSVGNPSNLDDYYRKRNRYLITRAGQEVFELVEGVLAGVDEIGDVQAGRLRDLHHALKGLNELSKVGFDRADSQDLADVVRTVFDLHESFTKELTQFFTELNQRQSRYDLDADEVQFFATVLVDYVHEQLAEIERMTRPIARTLEEIISQIADLLPALQSGLAARVEREGLAKNVSVRRLMGTALEDWKHLEAWFAAHPGQASRVDGLTRQAVAAVRTLTANVTRLSRVGLGATSRRSDFVRLAGFFDQADSPERAHEIAAAAFGLGSCRRLGDLAADYDDPAPTITPWRDAPRAIVPLAMRERGETTIRGTATPITNRRQERELLRRRRERDRASIETAASELLACAGDDGHIHGAQLSNASFSMLRELISRSGLRTGIGADRVGTLGHAALLLIDRLTRLHQPPAESTSASAAVDGCDPDGAGRVSFSRAEIIDILAGLAAEHRRYWSKDAADNPDRLTGDVLDLLCDHRLVEVDGDVVWLLPPAWRYSVDVQYQQESLRRVVAAWEEPWAETWSDSIAGAGLLRDLDGNSAARLATDVRRLLDHLANPRFSASSRTEIAAALYGSAHALDTGTRRASAVTHALRCPNGPLDERELWETAGILPDRVSAPALVWWLPVAGDSPLDIHTRFALYAGLPLHLSLFALRRHPVSVDAGTSMLVVENPRLVEAAAEWTDSAVRRGCWGPATTPMR